MKGRFWISFIFAVVVIPLTCMAGVPSLVIDMDPNTPAIDTEILVNPGDTFSVDVVLILSDSSVSLSSFGYSLMWDAAQINSPSAGNISTAVLESGWVDFNYLSISSPYIYNFAQGNISTTGHSDGPLTSVVATIAFTVPAPVNDGSLDIQIGFYSPFDAAYDKDSNSITPVFQGGRVNVIQYQLTTSISPPVNGTISPDCSGGCLYDNGTVVLLTAKEDNGFPFDSWTGCDSPAGFLCTMTMNAAKTVEAVFDPCMFPARIINTGTSYYESLQNALSDAEDNDVIETQESTSGDIVFTNTSSVILKAGYECDYLDNNGITTIVGNMAINNGEITLSSGILEIQ